MKGYPNKAPNGDVTDRHVEVNPLDEDIIKKILGGSGIAAALLTQKETSLSFDVPFGWSF